METSHRSQFKKVHSNTNARIEKELVIKLELLDFNSLSTTKNVDKSDHGSTEEGNCDFSLWFSEDDDDSVKDPDYSGDTSDCNNSSDHSEFTSKKGSDILSNFLDCSKGDTHCKDDNNNLESSFDTSEKIRLSDIPNISSEVVIDNIPNSKGKCKQYFCIYCQKLITKFARHLQEVHKEEIAVKEFMILPKGCPLRKKMIEKIRNKSSFTYNTNKGYNSGQLIVRRRPQEKYTRTAKDFKVCPSCKVFFSKVSLRRHYRRCDNKTKLGDKTLNVKSNIAHGQIHKKANTILRTRIFPRLRSDDVTDIIRFDELAIIYGNKMSEKYRSPHLHKMIRSKLRLIGRLLLELKKNNSLINDFTSIFHPVFYDDIINAVNRVALYNPDSLKYKSPATAFAYGTLLKKTGKILINEYIKKNDEEKQKTVRNFLSILEEDYSATINKTVEENQSENKRLKKPVLPSVNDIKKLTEYLTKQRRYYFKMLNNKYTLNSWRELCKLTLTSMQVFNRRRAGEIERVKIEDFNSYESIDQNTDYEIYSMLSPEGKEAAKRYVRFLIRGKRGRVVPVILHEEVVQCVKIILKYRSKSGVPEKNPFVFGLAGRDDYNHLNACLLLKEYSEKCSAAIPSSLRGTELRKQIATLSLLNDIKESEVTDLCAHLGHARKIHEENYRLPLASRDISRISQLLEKAQGGEKEVDESDDEIEIFSENVYPEEILQISPKSVGQKKPRSVSPIGYVKRISWNEEEITIANKLFAQYIESEKLPSSETIANAVKDHPELKLRNELQLKTWINNQIIRRRKANDGSRKRKRENVNFWTEQEKKVLRDTFAKHIERKKLPAFSECDEVIQKYPVLSSRKRETVKAWIYNEIKRNSKME